MGFLVICSLFDRFTDFGSPNYKRPVEDLAFAVARFIQKGGSFVNYYMVCCNSDIETSFTF